eukprot:gene32271-14497_t
MLRSCCAALCRPCRALVRRTFRDGEPAEERARNKACFPKASLARKESLASIGVVAVTLTTAAIAGQRAEGYPFLHALIMSEATLAAVFAALLAWMLATRSCPLPLAEAACAEERRRKW